MSRHPGRLRRQPLPAAATWDYSCGRTNSIPAPWTSGNLAQAVVPLEDTKATELTLNFIVIRSEHLEILK